VSRVDEASYYDTDKEKNLLNPSSKRWADLGEECAEHGVGVSAFVAPNAYVDLASIGMLFVCSSSMLLPRVTEMVLLPYDDYL
jgi:hypothetical protein